MPHEDPESERCRAAFDVVREALAARDEEQARKEVVNATRRIANATKVCLFTLDASENARLACAAGDLADPKGAGLAIEEAVREPLDRHRKKVELAASLDVDPGTLHTDESVPPSLVAKVIEREGQPLAVLAVPKEGRAPFKEDEQELFTMVCMNAANGFVRRRPGEEALASAHAALPAIANAKLAAEVVKVKTGFLKVPANHFETPLFNLLGVSAQIKAVRSLVFRHEQNASIHGPEVETVVTKNPDAGSPTPIPPSNGGSGTGR